MKTKSELIKNFMYELHMTPRDQEIDTTLLQLYSVKIFMNSIGYEPVVQGEEVSFGLKGFVQDTLKGILTREKFISFQDACRLHNGIPYRRVGDWVDFLDQRLLVNSWDSDYVVAQNSRIVKKVYLQRTKNSVKVQQNKVEFNL